jgi:hypothetical protein
MATNMHGSGIVNLATASHQELRSELERVVRLRFYELQAHRPYYSVIGVYDRIIESLEDMIRMNCDKMVASGGARFDVDCLRAI